MSLESHETDWTVQIPLASQEQQPSIYRFPPFITKLSPEAYRPQVVSFGPYHQGEDHLLHMEEHKHRVLHHFLNRSGKTLEDFLKSLREVAPQLEESYEALDPKWKNGTGGEFLALMITDGCFMLEIMRITVGEEKNDYAPNDPIFSTNRLAYITPYIRRDMLKLENQLPMLVLERLVAVERDCREGNEFINRLILKFFHSSVTSIESIGHCLHVLDVCRKSLLLPERESKKDPSQGRKDEVIIRSATELYKHGIRFKRSYIGSLKYIFFGGGVLRLPVIVVDDTTESMFLNLIAFERFHAGAGDEVSSYIFFMASIINTEGDIALLGAEGIIQNALGSDEKVAKLFSSLCDGVTLGPNTRNDALNAAVSMYCNSPRNKCRTIVRNVVIELSLLGGFFLFVLTFIQTVYSGLGYRE